MKLRERIAQNIIKHRKGVGLSQDNLAKCAGVSRAYIGHIENARHSISLDTLEKIADALDVDAADLMRPLVK
ncbi:MAG: helix-turn-helix transcriptional regulator [Pelagimonas sp.]|uniref:helix-turn-helix transcriptional regulator n=1 Tax=Pelagimonas sp. TaxID=2073170 RepID=UPI003D6AF705